jgi:hypothetical protein
LGLPFFLQRCQRKVVVPGRLIHVNSAGFHGRSRSVPGAARNSLQFAAFLAKSARAGKNGESPVITILEHLPFQIHNTRQEVFDELDSAPVLGFGCFEMKQDGPAVGIEDTSCLLGRGCIRWTAISPAVPSASILALQSHPRRCDNTRRIDFFGFCRSSGRDLFPVNFQTVGYLCFFHKQAVMPRESLVPRAGVEPAQRITFEGF